MRPLFCVEFSLPKIRFNVIGNEPCSSALFHCALGAKDCAFAHGWLRSLSRMGPEVVLIVSAGPDLLTSVSVKTEFDLQTTKVDSLKTLSPD